MVGPSRRWSLRDASETRESNKRFETGFSGYRGYLRMNCPRWRSGWLGGGHRIGLVLILATLAVNFATSTMAQSIEADRPNVLWILVDDMSANFSCYGDETVVTPAVDELAARGCRFTRAFVTAPVCSPCRSALITGMYQTSIGAHHHRSGRGSETIALPDNIVPLPLLFQQAGYYTAITSWPITENRLGKTDYNFQWPRTMYDGADWTERESGQPFFAQVQLPGGKLRGGSLESCQRLQERASKQLGSASDSTSFVMPPWIPDDPVMRDDWAAYLDSVRFTDRAVAEVLAKLKADGDLENTVVCFMTDHGISHIRAKQFLYDSGIHVPLVICGAGIAPAVRTDLVSHIDLAATSLGLAGIAVPPWMQGRDLFARDYQPRDAVFMARDRCDETVDRIRAIRTDRFKLIHNGFPDRSWRQPNHYMDSKAIVQRLRELAAAGDLAPETARVLAPRRPEYELYDLAADPHELRNLADDPDFTHVLENLQHRLEDWIGDSGDQGQRPESESMYDSDMQAWLRGYRRNDNQKTLEAIEANIRWMKTQFLEGK